MIMTTRQGWSQNRGLTLPSMERRGRRRRGRRRRRRPQTLSPLTSTVTWSTPSIRSKSYKSYKLEMRTKTAHFDRCILYTFLDAWRYDEDLILSASQQEILDAVNLLERRCTYFFPSAKTLYACMNSCEPKERQILLSSPWFGYGTNYSSAMGGISRNATGHIVGATTAQLYWSIR